MRLPEDLAQATSVDRRRPEHVHHLAHALVLDRTWRTPTARDRIARTLESALELSAAPRVRGVLEAMPHSGVDDHDRVIGGGSSELPLERSGVERARMARLPRMEAA